MFEFLQDIGNYEERKVARFENESGLLVSTVRVRDSKQPYETAVQYPEYKEGKLVIVATYDTKEQAKNGHEEWVKKMTAEVLPDYLMDVSTAGVAEFCDALKDNRWRMKLREKRSQ